MSVDIKIGNQGTMKIITWPSQKYVNILDLKPEDIDPLDIANSLAKLCRYNGQLSDFYSVAQHSVLVAQQFNAGSAERKKACLHDSGEGYLGDLIAPLKYSPQFKFYLEIEEQLEDVICERFDLEPPLLTEEIRFVDVKLRGAEMRDLKGYTPVDETYSFSIGSWSPRKAKTELIKEFRANGVFD